MRHKSSSVDISTWMLLPAALVHGAPAHATVTGDTQTDWVALLTVLAVLAAIGAVMWLRDKSDQRKQTKRADELLRACTGMSKKQFVAADEAGRHAAILNMLDESDRPITFESGFRRNQRYLGRGRHPLEDIQIPTFTIERTVGTLGANARYLAANALLFNAGLISARNFDWRGLPLLWQDGHSKLRKHSGSRRFRDFPGVDSASESMSYIVKHRYGDSATAMEQTRIALHRLRKPHADHPAVHQAMQLISSQ